MKNFIKYSIIVVILVLMVIGAVKFIKNDYRNYTKEDIKTDMLQVRAKARLEFEKYHVNNENGLIGEKIDNAEYGISEEGNFFKWTKDTLSKLGLSENLLKDDEYYIVNYDTEEVIYSAGVVWEDGNTLFRLSEIEKAEEEATQEEQVEQTENVIANEIQEKSGEEEVADDREGKKEAE